MKTVAAAIGAPDPSVVRVRNLSGSLGAVVIASVFSILKEDFLIVAEDREGAAYLQNDLQNLIEREVFLFPMSYKRPYEFEETENANILMRAEVLNLLSSKKKPVIIVTYPEALSERVITKRSLASNTFTIRLNENLDTRFLEEFLHDYDFEKTDFVYEAGQFAVRGGIIDIFSFANEYPYRVELFGDVVDSIRTFEPGSQLSVESLEIASIIPDVQTKLVQEERQSFLDFVAASTRIWFRDYQLTGDVIQKSFEKVSSRFQHLEKKGGSGVMMAPEKLFLGREEFDASSGRFTV